MRRARYSVVMSLDGYIAGPQGEADWITIDPEVDFTAIFSQFDTILVGRRTFAAMVTAGRASMPGMKTFVFSRTLRQEDYPEVAIVIDGQQETLAALKAVPPVKSAEHRTDCGPGTNLKTQREFSGAALL
jgi:dihydrofolate reductase